MHHFEVHPNNTHRELRLARDLINHMLEEQEQWGKIYPRSVEQALLTIQRFYQTQAESEQDT
jgi:hypothetical protein